MSPSPDRPRRLPLGWLSGVALVALAPKCLLCLAAYAGVGALLGVRLGGPEICGDFGGQWSWPWVALIGAALGLAALWWMKAPSRRQRKMNARSSSPLMHTDLP